MLWGCFILAGEKWWWLEEGWEADPGSPDGCMLQTTKLFLFELLSETMTRGIVYLPYEAVTL